MSPHWPPLWSSGQSSWLQIRRPGFYSPALPEKKSGGSGTGSTQPREYNWGATWEKSSGSCLENREYGRNDPSRWPYGTLYPQKLAITLPTSGGRSVGVVRSRTQTMEFFYVATLLSVLWQRFILVTKSMRFSWLRVSTSFGKRHKSNGPIHAFCSLLLTEVHVIYLCNFDKRAWINQFFSYMSV
jgi:hypothetical protein